MNKFINLSTSRDSILSTIKIYILSCIATSLMLISTIGSKELIFVLIDLFTIPLLLSIFFITKYTKTSTKVLGDLILFTFYAQYMMFSVTSTTRDSTVTLIILIVIFIQSTTNNLDVIHSIIVFILFMLSNIYRLYMDKMSFDLFISCLTFFIPTYLSFTLLIRVNLKSLQNYKKYMNIKNEMITEYNTKILKMNDEHNTELAAASKLESLLRNSEKMFDKSSLDLSFYNKQLHLIGGDYIDFYENKYSYYIIIMDVSGHNVDSSLVISYMKSIFDLDFDINDNLEDIMEFISRKSYKFLKQTDKSSTLSILEFDKNSSNVKFLNSGNYLFHLKNIKLSEIKELESLTSESIEEIYKNIMESDLLDSNYPILGFKPEIDRSENPSGNIIFEKGDVLIISTDGIMESVEKSGTFFRYEYINTIIKNNLHRSSKEILEMYENFFTEVKARINDDISLIIVKRK